MKRFSTLLAPLAFFVNVSSNRSDFTDKMNNTFSAFSHLVITQPVHLVPLKPKSPTSHNFLGAYITCTDSLENFRARANLDQFVDSINDCSKDDDFLKILFEAKHYELAQFNLRFRISSVKLQNLSCCAGQYRKQDKMEYATSSTINTVLIAIIMVYGIQSYPTFEPGYISSYAKSFHPPHPCLFPCLLCQW